MVKILSNYVAFLENINFKVGKILLIHMTYLQPSISYYYWYLRCNFLLLKAFLGEVKLCGTQTV